MPLLGVKEIELNRSRNILDTDEQNTESDAIANKWQLITFKIFEEVDSAGAEISCTCARCRGCSDYKNSRKIECNSIQEEVEQTIIDGSVIGDLDKGRTFAKLPFLH